MALNLPPLGGGGGGGGGGAHNQPSLPSLPAHLQSDTHLTAHLASRFHVSLPTARLSSHALISINTYTSSTKGDGTKESSAMGGAEDMAERAYIRLGHRSENQAVLFLGESGSGKTTLRAHLLTAVLNKSSTPLSNKVSLAAYVFDTLTTTKTATTPTASKAGLFYELQYDTASTTNPILIGAKLLDHRLERSRIADVPTGERNFHVLYYLLAGTSAAEKTHLGFDEVAGAANKRWKYLGHPTQLKVGINDAEGFQLFKTALRKLEFPRSEIAEICQILASILHIGQLEFETSSNTLSTGDDSGGFSHEGGQTVTAVKNKDVLGIVAAFLGVSAADLQTTMGYKTKMIHKERVTVMLDPAGARANANELARTLYSLLVAYVIENINQKLCASEDAIANTISIIDFPGFAAQSSTGSALDQLLNNAACESIYNVTLQNFFDRKADMLETEEVVVPATSYFDNSDAVKGLLKPGNGLLSILDDQTRRHRTDMQLLESLRKRFEGKNPAIQVGSSQAKLPGSNFFTENMAATFTVKHFAGEVDYPVKGLVEENGEVISGDLLNLINSSKSDFVARLFGQEALQTVVHPQERTTVMQAQVSSKPMRAPSMMSRRGRPSTARANRLLQQQQERAMSLDQGSDAGDSTRQRTNTRHSEQGASGQFLTALENVTRSFTSPNTNCYFVFCLKPNDRRIANQFDSKCVRTQVQTFGIAEISQRLRSADFSLFLPFGEFLGLTDAETSLVGSEREKVEMVVEDKRWPANEVAIGATGVFLSERCWMEIAQLGDTTSQWGRSGIQSDMGDGIAPPQDPFGASKERLLQSASNTPHAYSDKKAGYFGSNDVDARSEAGVSAFGGGDMFKNLDTREQMAERGNEKNMVEVEEYKDSPTRKRWIFFVYMLTFFVPDFAIRILGRMPRKDVRMAWREKLAINIIIWFSCLVAAFFIVVFPMLICPKQYVFSSDELSSYNGKDGAGAYAAIRGQVFDIGAFSFRHYPPYLPTKQLTQYGGLDITALFPIQVSALCQGVDGQVDPSVTLDYKSTNISGSAAVISSQDLNSKYHDFRYFTNDSRPDWFSEQMIMLKANYKVGNIGYSPEYVATLAGKQNSIAILNGRVYDMTQYNAGGRHQRSPPGAPAPSDPNAINFMNELVVQLFTQKSGEDVTQLWNALALDSSQKKAMQLCLDNLFYVGDVDTRNSVRCQFAEYLVLAVSVLLASVIGFKFFAALQFGTKNMPENLDKFVMCQIPAYTEDEDSLRRAIDSAARMRYDDKRKLLVVICDGMIIGQGNDRPTPRIVLDILGVSETVDPEPLSFESLGEGLKQHNMGKVYSGLYEVQGHIVPFLVVVKVGKPSEVSRPGNRGKRDSQMIIMRFLNRVHYNLPMSPLELEMYHQIRNVIGVNPTFYEFMLQIDADTVVAPDSATRMVSAFLDDTRLIAVCGETALTNAKSSFVTMIQVYEYYISHNLSKAFESLFGSVTCLPGCFSMYRIRAAETGKPLFVSREVVESYSTIRVDTLHMKNLLHLGEDRYLTTLLLKYHNKYKTKYIFSAHAWTIAPDSWQVFLSQRRRWINSTVHNLMELIPLAQLCGFCCFSMRFIVFIDLLSTIVQPVTIAYIIYLIVLVVQKSTVVPITAFVLLGAIYGLQAIIFIARRKWEMIGWMVLYVLAIPVFSFGLPLYAFWHMDDFNWGNTRVVAGEGGQKIVISDEGKFDPASIPRKKWEEYQAELWDAQTARGDNDHFNDARSEVSGFSYATKHQMNVGMSEYGGFNGGMGGYSPASRPGSIQGGYNPYMDTSGIAPMPSNPSRMSFAASEMLNTPGHRGSQFGLLGGHHGGSTPSPSPSQQQQAMEMSNLNLAGMPSDDALLAEIREILRTADLMTVTKKGIKMELEKRFGVPLDSRRAYINSATEALLSGQL
ncbi:chitin synthase-like protein [Diplogelasinospora grovesii]|uniref:chitin synthase n=1 Tax=Diplogelasinospora grovesii TaxID=303347 RepID=A0AAN6S9K5_9PEZI|nr:chitin synthase-like protein [Diplogelasinospora grovesii]